MKEIKNFIRRKKVTYLYIDVENSRNSRELQRFLFNNGYSWGGFKEIKYTDQPYIIIDKNRDVRHGWDNWLLYGSMKPGLINSYCLTYIQFQNKFMDSYLTKIQQNYKI